MSSLLGSILDQLSWVSKSEMDLFDGVFCLGFLSLTDVKVLGHLSLRVIFYCSVGERSALFSVCLPHPLMVVEETVVDDLCGFWSLQGGASGRFTAWVCTCWVRIWYHASNTYYGQGPAVKKTVFLVHERRRNFCV